MGTNWTADSFNLTDYLVNMKHLGYNHDVLAKFEVNYHVIVYKYNYIYIGNANLGLEDRSYYLDKEYEDTMEAYLGVMIEAAIRLGAEPEVATAEMEQVLQFEKEIAQLLPSRDFRMNILNYRNFSALDELAPFLDWRSYVNGVLSPFVRWPESDPIIVQNPYFIGNISNLVMATDKRTLSNYLGWQVILESLPGLDDKWARLGRRMWIKLDGRPKLRPKWEYCLSTTKRFYPIGMSSLFVGSLSDTAKAQVGVVKDIVGYVIKAFQGIIKTNDWMDHETIDQAINKTNHINVHAGFPRELFNQSLVDQEYILDDFNSTQSYFMITLIVRRARMDKKYRTLHEFNVKGHWREYAKVAEVNAFYRPAENSIDFPISIIGAMDIDGERPMYLNFGKIGWVVGHEITHGFDNNGRHFDGKGEYRSWWSNLTSDMYDKKATCFSGQYSAYDIAGTRLKINGKMTMGENIADNGGMKESFKAYQEYVNTHGSERALPGLPYTPEQILFIESASFYCGKTRRQVAEYALKTEQHAPSKYR
ncbi:Endothelin-converting enzyme 1 [Halotydeus destructor]|nr:Endothelin-converting enzyme 1 [Halotydeus destructor]